MRFLPSSCQYYRFYKYFIIVWTFEEEGFYQKIIQEYLLVADDEHPGFSPFAVLMSIYETVLLYNIHPKQPRTSDIENVSLPPLHAKYHSKCYKIFSTSYFLQHVAVTTFKLNTVLLIFLRIIKNLILMQPTKRSSVAFQNSMGLVLFA